MYKNFMLHHLVNIPPHNYNIKKVHVLISRAWGLTSCFSSHKTTKKSKKAKVNLYMLKNRDDETNLLSAVIRSPYQTSHILHVFKLLAIAQHVVPLIYR